MTSDQVNEYITTYNAARDDLRKAVAMLRLHGPDALADEADKLRDADNAMFAVLQEPDDGEHDLGTPPKRLKQAAEVAAAAVQRFAKLARKHTAYQRLAFRPRGRPPRSRCARTVGARQYPAPNSEMRRTDASAADFVE